MYYIPLQNEYVTNFYKQNGYLEFEALMRLGITDYKNYIKRQFSNEPTTNLNSCIASKRILDQIEADVEECISSKSYIDLQASLPSVFNDEDFKIILDVILTPQRQRLVLVLGSFVVSVAFIEVLSEPCDSVVSEKAKAIVESGKYQQYQLDLQMASNKVTAVEASVEHADLKADKREERRKKAAGMLLDLLKM